MSELVVNKTRKNLSSKNASYSDMVAGIHEAIAEDVQRVMQVWRSAGRAAEVMIQCSTWNNVEHVIVYNSTESNPAVIEIMLSKGKEELGSIPGVLDVRIGRTIDDKSKYRYCWLVRFAHESVIEQYQNHPVRNSYKDNYFRPIAENPVTNDYEILDDLEFSQHFRA